MNDGSAAERTALAWSRTLLATAALCGFIAVSASRSDAPLPVVIALVGAIPILLLATSLVSRRVWARATSAMAGTARASSPAPTLALAGLTSALSLVALLLTTLSDGGHG